MKMILFDGGDEKRWSDVVQVFFGGHLGWYIYHYL